MNFNRLPHCCISLALLLCSLLAQAKAHSADAEWVDRQKLTRSLQFNQPADNTLLVHNVFGKIVVEGHDGSELEITADKTIWADSSADLQLGQKEIQLQHLQEGPRIHLYPDTPHTVFEQVKGTYSLRHLNGDIHMPDYAYQMDITVRVPRNTNLHLYTINRGRIQVSHIDAQEIWAKNINGPILMDQVSGTTEAQTINQGISIVYTDNPPGDSHYETINGDLEITFTTPPDADIQFDTMNGDFYTRYDVTGLAPRMRTQTTAQGHGVKYKLQAEHVLRLGEGGTNYTFKTLNGDIYVK